MHDYKQAAVKEGTERHRQYKLTIGGCCHSLNHRWSIVKSSHVSEPVRADWVSEIRTGGCTYHDSETTERSHGEQGDSGILKRGRQGQATLCLSLDTTGTGCRDYQSELSDSVLECKEATQWEAQSLVMSRVQKHNPTGPFRLGHA